MNKQEFEEKLKEFINNDIMVYEFNGSLKLKNLSRIKKSSKRKLRKKKYFKRLNNNKAG